MKGTFLFIALFFIVLLLIFGGAWLVGTWQAEQDRKKRKLNENVDS